MEINTITTTIYNVPEQREEADKISIWQLPKIAWACAILLSINLLIAGAILISPELNVNIYGEASENAVLSGRKPTAFVAPEPRARPVRAAMKMTPVIELLPEAAVTFDMELSNMPVRSASVNSSSTAVPAAYRQPAYASGDKAHEAVEKQMDFPRVTASLIPKPTTPATFVGTHEVTPRKATEREVRPTIIN